MARSLRKGPYCDPGLLSKVRKLLQEGGARVKIIVKTWSRRSTIMPDFVGVTLAIHDGRQHKPVQITEDMVGRKLGEFAPTRTFKGHAADKKTKTGK